MKKIAILLIAVAMPFAYAQNSKPKNKGLIGDSIEQGGQGYFGMSGCGLGSVLFGESENRGGQILSSTTNGLYSNNTFGMSSGTSNCIPEKAAKMAELKKNMNIFISANKEALANDIVKQDGDTIVALSGIVGCKDTKYLGVKLQSRYEAIYNKNNANAVTDNMYDVIATDRYLVENCQL